MESIWGPQPSEPGRKELAALVLPHCLTIALLELAMFASASAVPQETMLDFQSI
jgi:hypothetical protein